MDVSIEFVSSVLTLFILVFASGIVFYLKNKNQEKNSELKIESDKIIFLTPNRSAEFYLKITNESNYHRDLYLLIDEETVPRGWSIHFLETNFSLEPKQSIKIEGYLSTTEKIVGTTEKSIKLYIYSIDPDRWIDKTIIVRTSTHNIEELEKWRKGWEDLIDYINNFHKNLDQKISENLFGAYRVCKNFVDIYQVFSSEYSEVMLEEEKEDFMKKLKHCCSVIDENIKTSEHSPNSHD